MTSNWPSQVMQCIVLRDTPVLSSCVMADLSASFLSVHDKDICLLCQHSFEKKDVVNSFTQKGWDTLIKNAAKWKDINIPTNHNLYMFTAAHEKLTGLEGACGEGHEYCRVTLSTKSAQFRKRYGLVSLDEKIRHDNPEVEVEDEKPRAIVMTRLKNPLANGTCFVCGSTRTCDGNTYNSGGLGRLSCTTKACVEKINTRTELYLQDELDPFYEAACRFSTQYKWMQASNLDTGEIYLHQSCYIR
jgi:hypothetical protein